MSITFDQYQDSNKRVTQRLADLKDEVIVQLWEGNERMAEEVLRLRSDLHEARVANGDLSHRLDLGSSRKADGLKITDALNQFML